MSLTYVTSDSDYSSFRRTSFSFGSQSIGTADANRWVIVAATWADSFGNGYITGVTLDGAAMTLANRNINESEGGSVWYKKVTTGTTATIALTENAGSRSFGIAIYSLVTTDASPLQGSAQAENASAASVTSVTSGSAVVSVQGSTNYATAPTIGGEASNDVATNIDGNDYIRAYSTDNATSTTQSITSGAGASNHVCTVWDNIDPTTGNPKGPLGLPIAGPFGGPV